MKAPLALVAIAACAACKVAGPVVDRSPKPPPDPYLAERVSCHAPPSCDSDFELEDAATELRPLEGTASALDEDAGIAALDPDAIAWGGERTVLASGEPFEIVLDAPPEGAGVIELRGPVTLRLQNIARLEGARIASASPDSRVVFDYVTSFDLIVGDREQPFAGRLEARHSAFERASLNVARAQLDSAAFIASFVAVDSLLSRDGFFENVTLELGDALFAPSDLRKVHILRCGALSFFGSSLWTVGIPRCAGNEATRFYDSKVIVGAIEGLIDADTSKLETLRIGQHEPTELVAWASSLMLVNFCDFADDIAVERGQVTCAACSEGAFSEAVCKLSQDVAETGGAVGRANYCEALDEAGTCADPAPDRPRPHTNEE